MDIIPSEQKRIEMQFDSYCKTAMVNELKNIHKHRSNLHRHEKAFSELGEFEKCKLYAEDEYDCMKNIIITKDIMAEISNDLLYEALTTLSEMKKDIILLSYWLKMSDIEISKRMDINRRTVSHMRKCSLQHLKYYMEKI